MTGAGSAATCTVCCGNGAGVTCGCGCDSPVADAGAGAAGAGAGGAGGAAATSTSGVIPGIAISTSGKSSDVADDAVVSTAFVSCKSSGEFEVVTATGAGIDTIFGPPISGVALTVGAMLRI